MIKIACFIVQHYRFYENISYSKQRFFSLFFIVSNSYFVQVLAIYTYTIACPVEEFESPSGGGNRRTLGYSTVSHFNLVHVDCHTAAVRQMRGRDEWESALLQNANTR